MKMLTRDSSVDYLNSLKQRLEENGIPAVIQGKETARMIIPAFMLEPTLWVFLDGQYEDAAKLIMDPDHQVTTGIDVAAFYENQPDQQELNAAVNNTLGNMAAYVVLFIILVFVVTRVF